jgi:quercetin dioxygenase-like cupin family protein
MKYLIFLSFSLITLQPHTEQSMEVKLIDFEKMAPEKLGNKITRRYVSGENEMLARFDFKKGAIVPKHQHPNEQITYILKGCVKVTIEDKEYIVRAGQVLIIPPNTTHEFEALEDTIDLDVFSPPRQDWIEGTDNYLKK